jgi:Endonuclease/Exonuclease/phosphatase family
MTRPFKLLLLGISAIVAAGQARAQDFTLHTQNLLHFGWGASTAKCQQLDLIASQADIILVQELMTSAYPCPSLPANFAWQAYGPYGPGTYREYYGFLVKTIPTQFGTQIQPVANSAQVANASVFMRPPVAVRFRVSWVNGLKPPRDVWIANFHAVWGKNVGGRRAEATQVGNFYLSLRNVAAAPVIVGGDWNLRASNARGVVDPGFGWLADWRVRATIAPNDPTTLTAAGNPSSAYDHFVFTTGFPGQSVALNPIIRYPTAPNLWRYWRQNVSDHLGVAARVTFQ